MLKIFTTKFIFIGMLMPYRYSHRYISTCKLKSSKAKIFMKSLKSLSNKHRRGPEHPQLFLQTIGSGAYGAPQSLFVQSRFHRFLFNCGEGTRRISRANEIPVESLTSIFVTTSSWKNISGIPAFQSLLLSFEDYYNEFAFNIYGPHELKNFLREYGNLDDEFDVSNRFFISHSEEIIFQDSLVIKPVPLFVKGSKNISSKNIPPKYILAYICTFPAKEGSLSPEKLVSARVPPGPLVECLKNGTPVNLPNGKVVTPQDVFVDSFNASTFIVLEIPSVEYLETLISSSAFNKFKKDKTHDNPEVNDLEVIVHFSPPEVMKDFRYRQWVNSFSPSVSHIVINNGSSCFGISNHVEMQVRLNKILPNIFPLHHNPGVPFISSSADIPNEEEYLNPYLLTSEYQFDGPTVQSSSALLYHVSPSKNFDSSKCPTVDQSRKINDPHENEIILNSLKNLNDKFNELHREWNSENRNRYPSICFLGSGSGTASATRNCSCTLIEICLESCILLDCGDGTLNQLIRLMGIKETMSTLRKLKIIFISHRHQDHHIGLTAVLNERNKAFLEAGIKEIPELFVLGPPKVLKFLKNVEYHFDSKFRKVMFINNIALVNNKFPKLPFYNMMNSVQLEELSVTYVEHIKNSFGVALTHNDGWKIVYSGDCMPSPSLIKIGRNCDLLIHEATLEDGMEKLAASKLHSTFSQALQVGKDMNAKFTILTHFSRRYGKIPLLDEELLKENFGIAFDCMKVTFEDLPYLKHLYPILKKIFIDDFYQLVNSRVKRTNFRELLKKC